MNQEQESNVAVGLVEVVAVKFPWQRLLSLAMLCEAHAKHMKHMRGSPHDFGVSGSCQPQCGVPRR
jgi:hypothetical protein